MDRARRKQLADAKERERTASNEEESTEAEHEPASQGGATNPTIQAVAQDQVAIDPESRDRGSLAKVVHSRSRPEHQYEVADLKSDKIYSPDPSCFYDEEYEGRLRCMIEHVIDTEGPIHQDVLTWRIARHHNFQRAGRQIREIVVRAAQSTRRHTHEGVDLFFWPKGTMTDRAVPCRYLGRDATMRNPDYICREELAAIDRVLELGGDAGKLAYQLGIGRLSQRARERLEHAIQEVPRVHTHSGDAS